MHILDLGLYNYQIEFTLKILKENFGINIISEIDSRLKKIPRFVDIKIFKNGLQSMSRFTAAEWRQLMKTFIFVLDNIYNEPIIQNNGNSITNENLIDIFLK